MRAIVVLILAGVLVFGGLLFFAVNQEPDRRRPTSLSRYASEPPPEEDPGPVLHELPPEEWTPRLLLLQRRGSWAKLAEELSTLREREPQRFAAWELNYLLGRAQGEAGDHARAITRLEPYLAQGHPFRPWALYHASRFFTAGGQPQRGSEARREIIAQGQTNPWWRDAIADEVVHLTANADVAELDRFAASLRNSAPSDLRRDLDSVRIDRRASKGDFEGAWEIALPLLRANVGDDAAERAARALDASAGRSQHTPERIRLLGEVAQSHRRYDRAVELLRQAREASPRDREDLTFAIGRSQFGAEEFASAEATYLDGSRIARSADGRATFLFHASRCAQLMGDDDRAIRHLNAALAAGGRSSAISAALTQRMRTQMFRKAWPGARADLARFNSTFPRSDVRVEAATHLAVGRLFAGDPAEAERILSGIPSGLGDASSRAEVAYWRARAAESTSANRAVDFYLQVLRTSYPTHYSFFSHDRLQRTELQQEVAVRLRALESDAVTALESENWTAARRALTEAWLLGRRPETLERLREVYRKLPIHSRIVDLAPVPLPALDTSVAGASPAEKVMAMGLYDDAVLQIPEMYSMKELDTSLTQALALGRAGAGRESVLATEILMRRVPDDYVPEALPRVVLELLYPRYYWNTIERRSRDHGADPRLVLSIMREESRFNPRAKSAAAARGLLQFIITTARSVGQSLGLVDLQPDDLYDPEVIINLGARYVADLLKEFDGNPYRAAAAYNAGPVQTKLWSRLLPGEGDDVFMTFVNFTETKHYVRKVLNSYRRYGQLYGGTPDAAGLEARP